jgi:hypothetical protein
MDGVSDENHLFGVKERVLHDLAAQPVAVKPLSRLVLWTKKGLRFVKRLPDPPRAHAVQAADHGA